MSPFVQATDPDPTVSTLLKRMRSDAFTYLTVLGWPGDVVAATEVPAWLECTAIDHAQPVDPSNAHMDVLLAVAEDNELRIDVRDPSPEFPGSEAASNARPRRR